MADATIDRSATSNIFHVFIGNSSVTTGAGLTGLTSASSGLIISAMKPGDASATVYSVASSNVETITTIGTYAAPTSGKIRFKEIDSTNRPGWYEFHPANALFSVSADTTVTFTFIGATNMRATSFTVQVGSPANMVRINGDATNGNNATLSLKQLNVKNSDGDAIYAACTTTNGNAMRLAGYGNGFGLYATGGNGTLGTPATAQAGIGSVGGNSWNGGGNPTDGQEWGGPGVRFVGGDGGAPGMTLAGHLSHPALWCTQFSGASNVKPVIRVTSYNANPITSNCGMGFELNDTTSAALRFNQGSVVPATTIFDASGLYNFNDWFSSTLNVNASSISGPITGLLSDSIDVTASTANTVTCGALAGIYPDDHFNNFFLVCSNYNTAVTTDYEGSTGKFTIRCLQTDGNWISNPDPGTPDTIQFASFPFEMKSTITAAILDGVIESGISASSSLTNDTGTQLTSINLQQAIALIASAVVGKLAGAATTNVTTKQVGKPSGNTRIDATVDSSGNRSSLTLKVPD